MPISYFIDIDAKTVLSTFSGEVTNCEITSYQNDLREDPQFSPEMHELMDCSCERVVNSNISNVMILVASSPWAKGSRRAIFASTDLSFGVSRVFENFISKEHGNVSVFRTLGAAKEWLNNG